MPNWMDLVRGKQEGEKQFLSEEEDIWYVPKVMGYAAYNGMILAMQGADKDETENEKKVVEYLCNEKNQKEIIMSGIARHNMTPDKETKKGFSDEDFSILCEFFPKQIMQIATKIMRISAPLASETETS